MRKRYGRGGGYHFLARLVIAGLVGSCASDYFCGDRASWGALQGLAPPVEGKSEESELFALPPTVSPAVKAILATNPVLPWECARAAKILADLGEFELAKGFLRKVLNHLANLSEQQRRETLVDFEQRFGVTMFFEMARRPELTPDAKELADALAEALDAHRRDPERLRKLVNDLAAEEPQIAVPAAEELRRSGSFAVGPMLQTLAAAEETGEPATSLWRGRIYRVLAEIGAEAIGPLKATLESPRPTLAIEAVQAIRVLRAQSLVPHLFVLAHQSSHAGLRQAAQEALIALWGRIPEPQVAAKVLVKEARARLEQAALADPTLSRPWWFWEESTGLPDLRELPLAEIAKREALQLAQQAARLAPEDTSAEILAAVAEAELAAGTGRLADLEAAAKKLASSWGDKPASRLLQILFVANETGFTAAAAISLAILAERAGDKLIFFNHVDPSPVVQCLRNPDRRVRYFALSAVLRHAQDNNFAGASWTLEALCHFLATEGKARILLAIPNAEEAMRIAGYFIEQGYQVEVARSGREVFRLLTSSPDFELAYVDVGIDDPPVELLLQQLRGDCRVSAIPIGLVARAGLLERASTIAGRIPRVVAFSRPHEAASARWQLEELRRLEGGSLLTAQERAQAATELLSTLASEADRLSRVVPLARLESVLVTQLLFPERAPAAISLLGRLGTHGAQTTLVQYASRPSWPPELRRQAVEGLAHSIARYGVLLTTKEIERQYDLYNRLGPTAPIEREILGAILDAFEQHVAVDATAPLSSRLP